MKNNLSSKAGLFNPRILVASASYPSNFRKDINVSGRIDAADVSIARQHFTVLPSPR